MLRNWRNTHRTTKLEPYSIPLTKISFRWIKNLNIRPDSIKLSEENIGKKFIDISFGTIWRHNIKSTAQTTKEKLSTNENTSKSKAYAQHMNQWKKRQPTEWKKVTAYFVSHKGWYLKYIKSIYNSTVKKPNLLKIGKGPI